MLVAYQSLTANFLEPINSLVNFRSTLQDLEADNIVMHLDYLIRERSKYKGMLTNDETTRSKGLPENKILNK